MNTYYQNSDPLTRSTSVPCLERLKIELNNKPYYKDEVLSMYLEENNIDPSATYNKDSDRKNLLLSVQAVLEALYNDVDTYRQTQTEFSTTGAAAKHIADRLNSLQKKINSIPDIGEEKEKSAFSFMFYTR